MKSAECVAALDGSTCAIRTAGLFRGFKTTSAGDIETESADNNRIRVMEIETRATPHEELRARLLLILILFGALCVRLYDISRAPWIDELLTHDGALESVKSALSQKFYPLTYLLVHFCLRIEDTSFMLRVPSLAAGLLGIWLTYRAGWAAYSRSAGLIAALLLAINSAHIVYSQEARYYSFMAAASAFSLWMLWRALMTSERRYWIGFSCSIAFGALTQGLYYLFLVGITLPPATWLLLRRDPSSSRSLRQLVLYFYLGLVPAGIAYVLYRSVSLGTQTLVSQNGQIPLSTFRLTVHEYCYDLYELVNCWPPQVVDVFVWAAAVGLVVLWRTHRGMGLVCLGAIFLAPFPLFFITVRHWYASKYFISQLPLFLVLASVGIVATGDQLRKRLGPIPGRLLLGAILIAMVIAPELYEYRTYRGRMRFKIREWQDVAPPIVDRMSPNDLVLHMSKFRWTPGFGKKGTPIEWYELNRYLARYTPAGHVPIHPMEYTGTSTTVEMRKIVEENSTRTIWLVADKYANYEFEPALLAVMNHETDTFRHLVYSIGEPTVNLLEQPQPTANSGKSHPFRFACSGATTVSLAVRRLPARETEGATNTAALDPRLPFTLSAYITFKNIRPDPDKNAAGEPVMNERTAGFIGISGQRGDGKPFARKLTLFDGSSDWHQVAIRVHPDELPELRDAQRLSVDFGVGDKKGSMRVDKVQLEAKDHATPFTPEERLPHDEALRLADGAKVTTASL